MRAILVCAALLLAPTVRAQSSDQPAGTDGAQASSEGGAEETLDVSKMPLTPDSIRQVIAFHQPKIQACYEELLASRKKPVEGKILTAWTITAEGLVSKPRVLKKGSTLKNSRLNDCVVAVLASMEFPRPKDGRPQPVEYPFNLKAIK